jgi:hypothetical protein
MAAVESTLCPFENDRRFPRWVVLRILPKCTPETPVCALGMIIRMVVDDSISYLNQNK